MNIQNIPDGPAFLSHHRFGNHAEDHRTLCSAKMPFQCTYDDGTRTTEFDIDFDVIDV